MSAPGFPDDCGPLVSAMGDLSTVFDLLRDTLLEIHHAHTQPDAVRLNVAEGLAQIDEGYRLLFLEAEGGEA